MLWQLQGKMGQTPFRCGFVTLENKVIAAAPFIWTIGKHRDELREIFKRRGWKCVGIRASMDMT